jgi:hypothetical protein
MAKLNSREEFKQYCLRRLGEPLISINVSDEQTEDRLDDALNYYQLHHYNAVKMIYLKHQLTQLDISNGYIDVPDEVKSVTKIFPIDTLISQDYMFDVQFQIIANNLSDFSSVQLMNYEVAMQHLRNVQMILVGQQGIRFTEHEKKLYIDDNLQKKMYVGAYVIAECYAALNPETFPDIWGDYWLRKYATALIKKQWGSNLSKYSSMPLPGGLVLNGPQICMEAEQEIAQIENECKTEYELPVGFFVG